MWSRLAHLCLPRHSNRHRPRILAADGWMIVGVIILVFHVGLSLALHLPLLPSVLGEQSTITTTTVLEQVNAARTAAGLSPLEMNEQLARAAQAKAQDMLRQNYWSHTAPAGTQPWDFIDQTDYHYSVAGENLARDFHSTSSLVAAWLASPTHRDNLLHDQYRDTGIAVVEGELGGRQTILVVELFGTPEKTRIALLPAAAYATARSFAAQVAVPSTTVLGARWTLTPLDLYRGGIMALVIALLGIMWFDAVQSHRRRWQRAHSKNLAHIILLLVVVVTIVLAEGGHLL